jgi:Uma2 family endonuclease
VIEILSPATAERDKGLKQKLYAKFGVQEYWLVHPDKKTIEVMTLAEEGFKRAGIYKEEATLKSPLLKGISIKVGEIF